MAHTVHQKRQEKETIERCVRTYKEHLKCEHTSRTSACSDHTSHTSHIQVNTNKHPSFLFVPPLPTLSTTLSLSLSFFHAGIKKVAPNMKSLSVRFALSTYAPPPSPLSTDLSPPAHPCRCSFDNHRIRGRLACTNIL